MVLQLATEEPAAGPWSGEPLSRVVNSLIRRGPDPVVYGRPFVLAIDGRSNSGKTTPAEVGRAQPGRIAARSLPQLPAESSERT